MKKKLHVYVKLKALVCLDFLLINLSNSNAQTCTQVVLDNLYDPAVPATAPNALGQVSLQQTGGTILNGGERDIFVQWNSPFAANNLIVNSISSDPFFNGVAVASGSGAGMGNLTITYDGADASTTGVSFSPGLGNIDMSGTGSFCFEEQHDNTVGATLTYKYIVYTDATHYSEASITYTNDNGLPTHTVCFLASAFITGTGAAGPADFTMVNAVQFTVSGNKPNQDYNIGALMVPCVAEVSPLTLTGTVYHDISGINVGGVTDGTGLGNPSSTPLYANLLSADGTTVIATILVNADGTYELPVSANTTYIVQITTNQGVVGDPTPITALPTTWFNTGDVNPTDPTATVATPGLSAPVEVVTSNVVMVDFGIQQGPQTAVNLQPSQSNPGGTTSVTVPTSAFQISNVDANPNTDDPSTGTVTSINIPTFPTNATSITVNGVTYTSATFPVGGITIPYTDGVGPNQTISVDPIDGAVSVVIPIIAIDNAGVADPTAGSITLPFTTPLPIDLISFSGKKANETIVLTWKTANEKEFSHFSLEKSADGKEFGNIATVNGNGNNFNNYTDNLPNIGNNYYRLKMVDLDGSFKFSKTVAINYEKDGSYLIIENPVQNGQIMLNTNLDINSFRLISSTGKEIPLTKSKIAATTWVMKYNVSITGIYYLVNQNNSVFNKKLLIQ